MTDDAHFPDVDSRSNGKSQATRSNESALVRRANKDVAIADVASWLGLVAEDTLRCPGEVDGDERGPHTGVHYHLNGIKCPHGRCVEKGDGPSTGADGQGGYRTCVGLVAEVRGVDREKAARLLLEQFDLVARVSVGMLQLHANRLKRKKKDNRLLALGVQLDLLCKQQPIAADSLEQLCRELGVKFHDCEPSSIAELFSHSLSNTNKTVAEVETLITVAQRERLHVVSEGRQEESLGTVYLTPVLEDMADGAEKMLAKAGGYYQHGTEIARIVHEKKPAKRIVSEVPLPILKAAPAAALRETIGNGEWMMHEPGTDEPKRVLPPEWIVTTLMARTNWSALPNVERVVECPMMRADGTIVTEAGYDEASGVWYAPNDEYPPVPEHPTSEQLQAAVEAIRDVFHDVPFERPEHEGAAFAAILTLVGRDTFRDPGNVPCFVVDATCPGSGKDQLVRLISIIGTGNEPYSSQFTEDEAEQRKRITSIAMGGFRMVLFGNVATDPGDEKRPGGKGFGGGPLCDALTTTKWSDRVLGESRDWSGPLKTIFFASANNMSIQEDMFRRICPIRLNWGLKGIADPSRIPDDYWHHRNLLSFATKNRPRLVTAALTILRAYFAAGCPDMKASSWGSYEAWSRTILGAVRFAGLTDPAQGREQFVDRADHGRQVRGQFLSGIYWLFREIFEGKPMLAADIVEAIRHQKGRGPNQQNDFVVTAEYEALTEAVQNMTLSAAADRFVYVRGAGGSEKKQPVLPNPKMLGGHLGKLNGTLVDVTPRIRPPEPPRALVDFAATATEQEVHVGGRVVGKKDPNGTMYFKDGCGRDWACSAPGAYGEAGIRHYLRRDLVHGWVDWWPGDPADARYYPTSAVWRTNGAGQTEMQVPGTSAWVPQPPVQLRIVAVGEDRRKRMLWAVERIER